MENEHMDQIKNYPTKPPLDMEISACFFKSSLSEEQPNFQRCYRISSWPGDFL